MTEYVAGFLVNRHDQVAMVLKSKPAWQAGLWNGVGGKIEPGETPFDAMVREYEEEAGVVTFKNQWQHRVTLTFDGGRVFFFVGDTDHQTLTATQDQEVEPVVAHQLSNLPRNLMPNLRWIIPLCMDTDISGPVEVTDMSNPATNGAAERAKRAAV